MSIAGRTSLPQHRSNGEGFALIELVAVVLLMAVAMAMVLNLSFRQGDSYRLRASGRKAFAFFNGCRDRAVLDGVANACSYDPVSRTLTAELGGSLPLPDGVGLLRPEDRPDDRPGVDPEKSEESVNLEAPYEIALFYADGSAEGGTLWLAAGDMALSIRLDPVLGTPKVAKRLKPVAEVDMR